jgi:hypothetical protein
MSWASRFLRRSRRYSSIGWVAGCCSSAAAPGASTSAGDSSLAAMIAAGASARGSLDASPAPRISSPAPRFPSQAPRRTAAVEPLLASTLQLAVSLAMILARQFSDSRAMRLLTGAVAGHHSDLTPQPKNNIVIQTKLTLYEPSTSATQSHRGSTGTYVSTRGNF